MAVLQADLDLLKKHLPSLGVTVAGKDPSPDEVLAGLERYSKMNNEIGDDKVVFNKDVGFTSEMKSVFLASIQRTQGLYVLGYEASITEKLRQGKETPDEMKKDPQKFFAFLKDGPKIVEALSNLQKENFFKKPAPAQAPAPVTPPPVAQPQVTTGPKPGDPQTTTGGNPSAGLHINNVYGKGRQSRTVGSPASATSATTSQANPPPLPPAGAVAPDSTSQTGGTNGGGQGVSPPENKPQTTELTGDVKVVADMVRKALGIMATSDEISDMPVPDGKAGEFGVQANASLHHLLKNVKTAMRFEGKEVYGGSLDGQYSPAIGQSLIAGYAALSDEAKEKILPKKLREQLAKEFPLPKREEGDEKGKKEDLDGTTSVRAMVAGLDTLYKNGLIDNAKGKEVENKKAEMFLKVMDYLPGSFKGQIFNFLQSSQIGQLLMKMLEAFTGIPISKMIGVKTEGPEAKSNSNLKAGVQQELAEMYNKALAESGNDPAKLKEGMLSRVEMVSNRVAPFVPKELYDREVIKGVVEKVLNEANGDGAKFAAAVMREVDALKGNPNPGSNGPAVAPQTAPQAAPQTPPPAPAPQEESQTPPPVEGGVTPTGGSPVVLADGNARAYTTSFNSASGARVFTAGYGGLDAGALSQYARNPVTSLGASNNPSVISTAPESPPPAPQVASAPSGNINDLVPQTLQGSGGKVKLDIFIPEKKTGYYLDDQPKLLLNTPEQIAAIKDAIGLSPTFFNPNSKESVLVGQMKEDMLKGDAVVIIGLPPGGLLRKSIDNFAKAKPESGLKEGDVILVRKVNDIYGKPGYQAVIVPGRDITNDWDSFKMESGVEGFKKFAGKEFFNKIHMSPSKVMVADANEAGVISLKPMTQVFGPAQGADSYAMSRAMLTDVIERNGERNLVRNARGEIVERHKVPELMEQFSGACIAKPPGKILVHRQDDTYAFRDEKSIGIVEQWKENARMTVNRITSIFGNEPDRSDAVDPTKICAPGMKN